MKLEEFKTLIELYKKGSENISHLYDVGVDLLESKYEVSSIIHDLLFESLKCFYTEDGVEWVSWFIFENEYGNRMWRNLPTYKKGVDGKLIKVEDNDPTLKYGAHDENDNPICYSIETLHQYIQENHLKSNA